MAKAAKTETSEPEQPIMPSDPADDPELTEALREFEEQEARIAEMKNRLDALDAEAKEANERLTAAEDDEQDALEVYAESGSTKALDKATAAATAAQRTFVSIEKKRAAVQQAIQARKTDLLAAENRLALAQRRYWQAREQAALEKVREALPLIAAAYWCHQGAMDSSQPIYVYLHDPAATLGLTENVLTAHQPSGPVPIRRVSSRFLDPAERFNITEYQRHHPEEMIR